MLASDAFTGRNTLVVSARMTLSGRMGCRKLTVVGTPPATWMTCTSLKLASVTLSVRRFSERFPLVTTSGGPARGAPPPRGARR